MNTLPIVAAERVMFEQLRGASDPCECGLLRLGREF